MILSVIILSVTALVVTSALLGAGLWLTGRHGPTGTSVRYGIAAGVVEVGAAAMYLLWINVGGSATLATANALLVLGPAMIPLAFHAILPSGVARACVVVSFGSVAAVAVTSLLLPAEGASTIRVGALALVCACAAVTAAISPEARRPSIRVLAIAVAVYAFYSGIRVIALLRVDADATPVPVFFTDIGAIPVGVVIMMVVGAATVLFWVDVHRDAHREIEGTRTLLVIADRDVSAQRPELVHELREAASVVEPTALPVHGGAALAAADTTRDVVRLLRDQYLWTDEEIALVATISSR
ncbi:hypothetical protein MTES_1959 [Microbacterium testaceum StLB037]|uniref:Uncharacterized protein n=1 Tax=Microbacterium testaceum (strain StLB037) TaxID=979556 RepID=E8ND65_MICTS|nr:hypothetical protein [Microbacterium testaceum]BAJ74923.1 hypothetical protein MTES_1959 [Microbacterium testaceum StLB037]